MSALDNDRNAQDVEDTLQLMKAGGPAFPRDHAHDGHNGMSLRDYFAGKAMASEHCVGSPEVVAKDAYRMADAMLEARKA